MSVAVIRGVIIDDYFCSETLSPEKFSYRTSRYLIHRNVYYKIVHDESLTIVQVTSDDCVSIA